MHNRLNARLGAVKARCRWVDQLHPSAPRCGGVDDRGAAEPVRGVVAEYGAHSRCCQVTLAVARGSIRLDSGGNGLARARPKCGVGLAVGAHVVSMVAVTDAAVTVGPVGGDRRVGGVRSAPTRRWDPGTITRVVEEWLYLW